MSDTDDSTVESGTEDDEFTDPPDIGTRVKHEEMGVGTVKQHPDGREGTYVYFDNTSETTIVRVRYWNLTPVS